MVDFSSLNPAQYAAVTAEDGPILVIAGAGSGKTRTLVYRLAWLTEQGVQASEILLLTFTKKASKEMLERAGSLLGANLHTVQGGTFHSFAYATLKHYPPSYIPNYSFTIMDSHDQSTALAQCKEKLGLAKGDKSFPKTQTILSVFSKSRNKELAFYDLLKKESPHLLPYLDDFSSLYNSYEVYKKEHFLLDYDDLLFELEKLLLENNFVLEQLRQRFRYIMVDEYQDTNKVQARLVRLLAGPQGNVMAVGDDAQSIYAFRGADVRNILDFQVSYPKAKLIYLEQNYRSTQEVLNIANSILEGAGEAYKKHLFSEKQGEKPSLIKPLNDLSQAGHVARYIEELLEKYQAKDIAVLFRAAYQSYNLEIELNKRNIKFKKYGGLRYIEAAHIKDMLAYVRLLLNPLDMPSFFRLASYAKGVGSKTAEKLFKMFAENDKTKLQAALQKYPSFLEDLLFLDKLQALNHNPMSLLEEICKFLRVIFLERYPDDYPKRLQDLEELTNTAVNYEQISDLLADLSLENDDKGEAAENCVTLSTVHSAKGLEWGAVLVIDLVQDRFPSKHALVREEDFEEERRLLYVACTRAKEILALFSPASIYDRGSGSYNYALESPFVMNIERSLLQEMKEGYMSNLVKQNQSQNQSQSLSQSFGQASGQSSSRAFGQAGASQAKLEPKSWANNSANNRANSVASSGPSSEITFESDSANSGQSNKNFGYCEHKIFGKGKIVEKIQPDKYRVNFMGFGLKVIVQDYLTFL